MAEFIDMQKFVHGRKAQLVAAIVACCLFAGLPLLAQEAVVATKAPAEKLDELPPIVVYGGYATPQMWKVSKGDHVMWVLNIGEPAPADVRWRSKQLEARVAESQLVLYPSGGKYTSNVEYLSRDEERYSGKGTLKDELPPELYERWRALKTAYFPRDSDLERWRPSAAIGHLEGMVMNLEAMLPPPQTGPGLRQLVDKAVKEYKVKVRTVPTVSLQFELTKAEQKMEHMNSVRELGDVKCFTQHLDYFERLIEYRNQQALATRQSYAVWRNVGDCPLRQLTSGDLPDPAAARSAYEKFMLQDELASKQVDAEWMAAAQTALAKNKSTFAVVYTKGPRQYPMLWEDHRHGYIAKFRELGYDVVEPGSVGE